MNSALIDYQPTNLETFETYLVQQGIDYEVFDTWDVWNADETVHPQFKSWALGVQVEETLYFFDQENHYLGCQEVGL